MYINKYIVLIISLFSVLSSCKKEESKTTPTDSSPAIQVTLAQAGTAQGVENNQIVVSGKLEASQVSNISAKIMGRIQQVFVREGQAVRKGQKIAIIKSDDLQAQKSQAEAGISEAKAALKNAEINYQRFNQLYAQQSATKFELDNAQMQLDMAKSRVKQAQQARQQLTSLLSESVVKAPFLGTITARQADAGALASPGMPIVTLESTGNLVLKALVPESEIIHIKSGEVVKIIFQASEVETTGKIIFINPSTQFTGSQYEVEISLDGAPSLIKQLKSGMYAHIYIKRPSDSKEKEEAETLVLVPKTALVHQGQLTGIYTVSSQNTAVLRWLKLGKNYGDRVEVLSGLSSQERFVVQAEGKLFNGAKIEIK